MAIIALQLNDNTKPLLNQTYFNSTSDQFQDFTINLEKRDSILGISIVHKEKGHFWVPMTSVSWVRMDGAGQPVRKRGRPPKTQVESEL